MTKPTPRDNWTEQQWHKRAKTLIDGIRKSKFEFGKLVAEFHDHFNRHRDQYQEDWTVVCQRVLILKYPTCSLYETVWKTLGRVEFRDRLPASLHALHKIAVTYRDKPDEVVEAVRLAKITAETIEKEVDQLFLSGAANEAEAREEKKPGKQPEIQHVLERDLHALYGLHGRATVDRAMIIQIFAADILSAIQKWNNRWNDADVIHTLKSIYNIVDEDLDEAAGEARAEDRLQIPHMRKDDGEAQE